MGNPLSYSDPYGLWVAQAIGAGINLGFEGYNQYQSGEVNFKRLVVAGATGALGGFGTTGAKAVGFGMTAGAINNTYQQLDRNDGMCTSEFDTEQLVRSTILGGAGGLIGYGAGTFGRNMYRPPNVIGSDPYARIITNYGAHGSAIGAAGGTIIGNQ